MGLGIILSLLFNINAGAGPKTDAAVKAFFNKTGATAASVAIHANGKWIVDQHYGVANAASVYDLASLTKPIATAWMALWLVELGLAKIDEPISLTLPSISKCIWTYHRFLDFAENLKWKEPPPKDELICAKKNEITVEQLLRHRSGFYDKVPYEAVALVAPYTNTPRTDLFIESPILFNPGEKFNYADINFIILQKWINEKLKPLQKTMQATFIEEFVQPNGLVSTGFFSLNSASNRSFISTKENLSLGIVHDPMAGILSEDAGHAGLYASLDDMKKIALYWLKNEALKYATESPESFVVGEKRGLGWDVDSYPHTEAPRGTLPGGFGHTGFTGTSLWIEPKSKVIVVILTNRTYKSAGKQTYDAINELRKKLATIANDLTH